MLRETELQLAVTAVITGLAVDYVQALEGVIIGLPLKGLYKYITYHPQTG